MTPSAPAWSASGNDYRPIRTLQPAVVAGVTVLIEGEATSGQLEALSAQTQKGVRVVVVGGSAAEDVIEVATLEEAMATTDGSDVIAVLASGDIPNPQWLEAHLAWHRRAGNVVVIGESPDATRARLVRGSRRLLGNDDVFAAFQGSNVSFPRASWGSGWDHDLLSGWRLWNDGHFFAYEPGASTSHEDHQTSSGPVPGPRWADLIPHRTYRPGPPSPLYSTPKVSWVVSVASAAEADAAWTTCASSTYSDVEIVFHGPEPALERFTALSVGNPRVTTSSSGFGDAIRVSRGELVAILDPRARVPGELLGKAVSRFEEKPSSPIVRSAYAVNGDRYLRLDDLAAIDAEIGRDALPFFALVTRRELMKDRTIWSDPANRAWSMVLDRCTKSTVIAPVVGIPETVAVVPHPPGLADLASIGPRMIVRELVRQSRQQARADESEATSDTGRAPERVQVAYVGFIGHDNLGDEAVKVAIERLMPWGEFSAEPTDPKLLMIGGGTLINGRRYYLNRMLRQESAVVERAMFGTGVRSPGYWGVTEPMDDWFTFIDSAIFAAVRGPDSVRNLRTMGYERDLPIIGDPALSLRGPAECGAGRRSGGHLPRLHQWQPARWRRLPGVRCPGATHCPCAGRRPRGGDALGVSPG